MKTALMAMTLAMFIGCHHDVKTGAEAVNLWGSKVFETCVDLALGETLLYQFNANASVLFNVHYHQREQVIYAISEHLSARSSGTLEAENNARYCLMWTNPNTQTAKIAYDYMIQ